MSISPHNHELGCSTIRMLGSHGLSVRRRWPGLASSQGHH
jgi:hypothetical protein